MDFKKIISKVRDYEIRIRKAVNGQMRGDFDSVFKGSGLEFDDVRAYQYGDDVRRIDWNVSAKADETYIKVFREEKEQTVFFLLDVSNSQNIGEANETKLDRGIEITSVLTFSAVKEQSEVGLICFSDQKELYIAPDKGYAKAYEVIMNLHKMERKSLKTDLNKFIHYALNLIKRRSVVIFISDFIDENYEHTFKAMARKHDLIIIHLIDPKEVKIPPLGIVPLKDNESGKTIWKNTASKAFQKQVEEQFSQRESTLKELSLQYQSNYLPIFTNEDFVPKLVRLFRVRNKRMRRGR